MSANIIIIPLDTITVRLRAAHDFSFLKQLGKVFCVFDEQDSGNISFGVDTGNERLFEKWDGSEALFAVATKAVSPERSERYPSLAAFRQAWNTARE